MKPLKFNRKLASYRRTNNLSGFFNVFNLEAEQIFISIIPFYFKVTDIVDGQYYEILKYFSTILNFKIRLFKRFDGKWGTVDENGTSNGMLSNLQNGEADIGVAMFTLCCRRTEVADFLWSIDPVSAVLAIKSKNHKSSKETHHGVYSTSQTTNAVLIRVCIGPKICKNAGLTYWKSSLIPGRVSFQDLQ